MDAPNLRKETSIRLSRLMISPHLSQLRDHAERAVFSSVRTGDGFNGTEEQLALGFLAFFLWAVQTNDGSDKSTQMIMYPSNSLRESALELVERIEGKPSVIRKLRVLYPSFDPKLELDLGYSKSSSNVWMTSLSRGVVVSTRLMGYSFCLAAGIPAMLPPIEGDFGRIFLSIPPDASYRALNEWLSAVIGDEDANSLLRT